MKQLQYIANQVYPEGIDEIQLLLMCRQLGLHTALCGPPGTGKTHCIHEISRLTERPLFCRTCSTRTSENHIISYPALEREGESTVTRHQNGPLAQAMESGGIFYADEFDLLNEDTQKRMNSALDDRRYIDRNDGRIIKAAKNFWTAISYNPSNSIYKRDLEPSVADRFVHIFFNNWSPEFLAFTSYLKYKKAGSLKVSFPAGHIPLTFRAIGADGKYYWADNTGKDLKWFCLFTGKKITAPEIRCIYRIYDQSSALSQQGYAGLLNQIKDKALSSDMLPIKLARFVHSVNELAENGYSKYLKSIGLKDSYTKTNYGTIDIHRAGIRIISAALMLYHNLVEKGVNSFLAQSFAVRIVIDQICHGQYRFQETGSVTNMEILVYIARGMGLMAGAERYNTDFEKRYLKDAG